MLHIFSECWLADRAADITTGFNNLLDGELVLDLSQMLLGAEKESLLYVPLDRIRNLQM